MTCLLIYIASQKGWSRSSSSKACRTFSLYEFYFQFIFILGVVLILRLSSSISGQLHFLGQLNFESSLILGSSYFWANLYLCSLLLWGSFFFEDLCQFWIIIYENELKIWTNKGRQYQKWRWAKNMSYTINTISNMRASSYINMMTKVSINTKMKMTP